LKPEFIRHFLTHQLRYSEAYQFSSYPHNFFKIHFNIILQSTLGLPSAVFPKGLGNQNRICTPPPYVPHAITISFFFM